MSEQTTKTIQPATVQPTDPQIASVIMPIANAVALAIVLAALAAFLRTLFDLGKSNR
jgi:hypothetical protein